MTEEQLAELRSWAATLAEDGRPDTSAAGKAILLLIEEVESLRADLRAGTDVVEADQTPETDEPLRQRLGRLARHR